MRPLIVPWPFPLGGSIPPNVGFLNPGAWLMLWTQSAAQFVQCWSSYELSFCLERRDHGSMSVTYDVGAVSNAISQ